MVKPVKSKNKETVDSKSAKPVKNTSGVRSSVLACVRVLYEYGAVSEATSVARLVIWQELLERIGQHGCVATAKQLGLVERHDYDGASLDTAKAAVFKGRHAKFLSLTKSGIALAKEQGFKVNPKLRDQYRALAKKNGAL